MRTRIIGIRLRPEEFAAIEQQAHREGSDVGPWIRGKALLAVPAPEIIGRVSK